jgi:uncharacterized protein YgbK (DUF1537 family)
MLEWLVVADDRSGALEVAGEMAAWLGPVEVTVGSRPHAVAGAAVIDVGGRHCAPEVAARLTTRAASAPARHHGHKIDSTLRGNWADELVAVQRLTGARVVVVAAFPKLGRTCRNGVVSVDGVPVGTIDARRGAASPRPLDHLVAAGADDVTETADAGALARWLDGGGSFAVCDASTDEDLTAIGALVASAAGMRIAGTAASITAAVAATAPTRPAAGEVQLDGRVLVVCGSLHAVARAQVDALSTCPTADVVVVSSRMPGATSVTAEAAARAADELARSARRRLADERFDVLVILGGDTAAAVLGDEPMLAGGTVAPGMPWSRRSDGSGPLVVTKAGGFGQANTLVELLHGRSTSGAR